MTNLVDELARRGLLSGEQAGRILSLSSEGRETAVRVMIREGLVDQQVLATELAGLFGLPLAQSWPARHVMPEAVSLRFMRERRVIPADADPLRLTVILSDPSDEATLAALRLAAGRDLALQVAADDPILAAIERLEQGSGEARPPLSGQSAPEDDDTLKDLALDAPVIDLLNRLFREASTARATDLHVEPARGHVIGRRRVDGLLAEVERLPVAVQPLLIDAEIQCAAAEDCGLAATRAATP